MLICDVFSLSIPTYLHFSWVRKPVLDNVDEFNTRLLDSFSGEERVYHSAGFADEDGKGIQYPTEYLQSIDIPSPPH